VKYGSEEMKREYLPLLAKGEMMMAFGVTEPTADSDTSRIQTTATRRGGAWILNGQKIWTTNAQQGRRCSSSREPSRGTRGGLLWA
jgi:acyl-CoA dehydrogenase